MHVLYRFRHSTQWNKFECPGVIHKDNFLRYIMKEHGLQRVILEEETAFIRPSTWVVLRHVHQHWTPPPPRAAQALPQEVRTDNTERGCIEDEFGPDPYSTPPLPPPKKKSSGTSKSYSTDPFVYDNTLMYDLGFCFYGT